MTHSNDSLYKRIAQLVFEQAPHGVLVTDTNGIITHVNPAFTSLTGYARHEAVGKKASLLRSGRQDKQFYRRMWDSLRNTGSWQGRIWNRKKNGELYPEWLTIGTIYDEHGKPLYFVGTFSDISALESDTQRLTRLAYYDPLTKLPNRSLFFDRLESAIARAKRNRGRFGLIFADLDRFKIVNDSKGHSAGDRVLEVAAKRLRSVVRESDTVARLGGDEFIVIVENVEWIDVTTTIAEKIKEQIARPIRIDGHTIKIGVSLGIAIYPESGQTSKQLLAAGDRAMYQSKARGRNR